MKVCKGLALLIVCGSSLLVQAAPGQQIFSLYERFLRIDQLMQKDPVSYHNAHDCLQEMMGFAGAQDRWNSFVQEVSRNVDGHNDQQLHELCEMDEDDAQDVADAECLLRDIELCIASYIRLQDQ